MVSGEYIEQDVNIISIIWPVHGRKIRLAQDSSFNDVYDFINPAFGEIHKFFARIS
jgi:hypothetical protein